MHLGISRFLQNEETWDFHERVVQFNCVQRYFLVRYGTNYTVAK